MDNKYQHTPKILQKILVKILKKFNIYQDLCPIDWSSPIKFVIEYDDKNINNYITQDFIKIAYTDGYLVFIWDLFYSNIAKSWHFLNELNNPLCQPSILLHTDNIEKRIILWSKESYQGLTYEIVDEWLQKFIYILRHVKSHVLNNKELYPSELSQDKFYEHYSSML